MRTVSGNIFDSLDSTWVNPVNCVGVMGAGLALQFKQRFPSMFEYYLQECRSGNLNVGKVCAFKNSIMIPKTIILFPTKADWRNASRLEWIDTGLQSLSAYVLQNSIKTLSIPAVGCGYGALKWDDVYPLIRLHLDCLPCDVTIYVKER